MVKGQQDTVAHLSLEDRARLELLYEEVSGRLQEMALIVGRTLGLKNSEKATYSFRHVSAKKERASQPSKEQPVDFEGTEIICTPAGCGCYDYDEGLCFVC
jgi:hypothetical protein